MNGDFAALDAFAKRACRIKDPAHFDFVDTRA